MSANELAPVRLPPLTGSILGGACEATDAHDADDRRDDRGDEARRPTRIHVWLTMSALLGCADWAAAPGLRDRR